MQDIGMCLELPSGIMGTTLFNKKVASEAAMFGSMADVDFEFEPPERSAEEFRKRFMDMRKNIRLSAG
jgi:hypothetical protein